MKALSFPLAFTLRSFYLKKIVGLYQFCNNLSPEKSLIKLQLYFSPDTCPAVYHDIAPLQLH